MADDTEEVWPEADPDLPPPEPAPSDWAMPSPVEAHFEAEAGIEVQKEQREIDRPRFQAARRIAVTTAAFVALFLVRLFFVEVVESPFTILWILVPLYALTLYFVLRRPRGTRSPWGRRVDNLRWQHKVMVSVAVFLAVYIPFTFITGAIIPYASIVEYGLFAVLLLVLLRLSGRSVGVAPSPLALPPASHRLHQQVVAPLDDAHYQRTLWLNYHFVEKGKGAKNLTRRLEAILESNGVDDARRQDVLRELRDHRDASPRLAPAGSERRKRARDRRVHVLEATIQRMTQELERSA